jgi:phosphoglycerate dehydrogenase-like enzyme
MNPPCLVCYPALDPTRFAHVASAAKPLFVINARDRDEALAAMPDADAFFGKLTPELLERATRLRWVQSPTASLEHYLFPELVEHPSLLSNMRGLFSDVVADHALAMILAFARNLHLYRDRQRDARWEPVGGAAGSSTFTVGPGLETGIDRAHRHLPDCNLGVVGVGGIGAEICRRGAAFGMSVRGVDPLVREVAGVAATISPLEELDALLAWADFLVIAAPHTPGTARLFDAARLARMKPGSYLINIGRGAIVDLAALTECVLSGHLAGIGLDVYETEPLPPEHPLWRCENAILTPHIAAASVAVPKRHLQVLLDNIARFARGETPANLVNKREWF